MAEVGELEGGRADGAANDEEQLEQWNGDVPDDTKPWCKDLHRLVSKIYGEDRPGGEPAWWVDCDDDFLALEDMRRNLPKDSLSLLRNTAYSSASMTMVEYVTGRNASVSGLLFGNGETLGEWKSFTLLFAKPEWRLESLGVGWKVTVGTFPNAERATVARILCGSKPAGRADEAKTQHCYYVLLQVGDELEYSFEYVALQHIHIENGDADYNWSHEVPWSGTMENDCGEEPNKLLHFKPKSVSAVAKVAAQYASKVTGKKRKAEPKKPVPAASSSSSSSSDSASDEDESESD